MATIYESILFATDLSEPNFKLVEKVMGIVDQNNAQLHLVHAIEPFPIYTFGYTDIASIQDYIYQTANEKMKQLEEKFKVDQKSIHLVNKPIKQAILETAESIKAGLIIIGSHMNGFFSTVSGVISSCKSDVVVLRQE